MLDAFEVVLLTEKNLFGKYALYLSTDKGKAVVWKSPKFISKL